MRVTCRHLVTCAVLLSVGYGAAADAGDRPAGSQDGLRQAIAAASSAIARTLTAPEAADLQALYANAPGAPIWLDARGRPSAQAETAVALLRNAAAEGLRPADYFAADLATTAASLNASPDPDAAARFEVRLSAGVLRYCRHVHLGRVDPDLLGVQLSLPGETHDFAKVVRVAVSGAGIVDAVDRLAPPFAQYRALKDALARYRALDARGLEPPTFSETVHPGDPLASLTSLTALLIALGDLPPGTSVPASGVYDDEIAGGVARFQQRHSLDADGVIGRATATALQVPLSRRVRQIEFALDRLRWLPDLSGRRLIAVNIPMFRLWAWDAVPSAAPPALDMGVIVGRALDTRTPVFAALMPFVVFRPYWNVPSSIVNKEMLPEIRRDLGYLDREGLELVRGAADDAPVVPPAADRVKELADGTLRVRQRPGAENALGLVKFMFPNLNDVYLHGTPAQELFRHARRDFSHGCIRVEDPLGLAEWVLKGDSGWDRARVLAAMQGTPNQRLDLSDPVQVVIFYTTAAVWPGEHRVHFADDLYGQDRLLDQVW